MLASYVVVTCILGQFIPSIVALFALVCPLVQNMCEEMKISPSKMMYPIAIASVSCSFIVEPIGPYAAWYVTQNGYMESYGWTATQLNMWSETSVLLPVGLMTILLAIFVVPRFLPDEPDVPTTMVAGRALKKQEPLSPVREFLGYGIFIAVIVCLMLGFSSWKVTLIGAIAVVFSGVLTEREAIDNMNMSTVLLYVGGMGNAMNDFFASPDKFLHSSGATLTVQLYVFAKERAMMDPAFAVAVVLLVLTFAINLAAKAAGKKLRQKN